jgi:hypothetical protein
MVIRRLVWVAIGTAAVVTCGSTNQPHGTAVPYRTTILVPPSPHRAADLLPPETACRLVSKPTTAGC